MAASTRNPRRPVRTSQTIKAAFADSSMRGARKRARFSAETPVDRMAATFTARERPAARTPAPRLFATSARRTSLNESSTTRPARNAVTGARPRRRWRGFMAGSCARLLEDLEREHPLAPRSLAPLERAGVPAREGERLHGEELEADIDLRPRPADLSSRRLVIEVRHETVREEGEPGPRGVEVERAGAAKTEPREVPVDERLREIPPAHLVQFQAGKRLVQAVPLRVAVIDHVVPEAAEVDVREGIVAIPGRKPCRAPKPDRAVSKERRRPRLERGDAERIALPPGRARIAEPHQVLVEFQRGLHAALHVDRADRSADV